jgi:hypothetical protein
MGQSQSSCASDRATANQGHAFTHAPSALRIFRFAADSAPRVLELAHVSAFLRECAIEFGSADAALPGALRCEFASRRFFKLRAVVERNAARCPWLAEKLLACRSGAPTPAAALAPDVTRHDVNWGAEGARRHKDLAVSFDGFALTLTRELSASAWAQGAAGVTGGKHFFQVTVNECDREGVTVGWADDKIAVTKDDSVGRAGTNSSGAAYECACGTLSFGTAPVSAHAHVAAPKNMRRCVLGCLLDLDATPARMTVFVDGEPLVVQCPYDFPKDGRAWYPSVALCETSVALVRDVMPFGDTALHSCAM